MFDEDLSVFFDVAGGFALSATWNGASAAVLFDAPFEDVLGGEAVGTEPSVTVPASTWPGIARGATVIIDGKGTYTVREVRPIEDGDLKRLILGV